MRVPLAVTKAARVAPQLQVKEPTRTTTVGWEPFPQEASRHDI